MIGTVVNDELEHFPVKIAFSLVLVLHCFKRGKLVAAYHDLCLRE